MKMVNTVTPIAVRKTFFGLRSDHAIPSSYSWARARPQRVIRVWSSVVPCRCTTSSGSLLGAACSPPSSPRSRRCPSVIITGIIVSAMISEALTVSTTEIERSRNSAAARPCTKTIGPNTSTVVRVPAISGPATSSVPRRADSQNPTPSSRIRPVASATTIALSTRRPTARASPPRERMLMVTLKSCSSVRETSTESGTIRPMASDIRQSRRKSRISRIERIPPAMISWDKLESASRTNWACAATSRILTAGNSLRSTSRVFSSCVVTATVFAPASL